MSATEAVAHRRHRALGCLGSMAPIDGTHALGARAPPALINAVSVRLTCFSDLGRCGCVYSCERYAVRSRTCRL